MATDAQPARAAGLSRGAVPPAITGRLAAHERLGLSGQASGYAFSRNPGREAP
jgi:hypothetical protein